MKKTIAFFVAISILLSFGGCASMKLMLNSKTICDDTIEYLDNKYNANFEIVDSHFVFEPAQEDLVNVICKDDVYKRNFKVVHRLDSSAITIEDENDGQINEELKKLGKAEFTDCYGAVILSEKYAEILQHKISEDIYALCDVEFDDSMPDLETVNASFEAGLDDWKEWGTVKIYIFYNPSTENVNELIKKVISAVEKYSISMQFVYICATDNIDESQIRKDYNDNWNKYDDFIIDSASIERIDGFYTTAKDGAKDIQIIKE